MSDSSGSIDEESVYKEEHENAADQVTSLIAAQHSKRAAQWLVSCLTLVNEIHVSINLPHPPDPSTDRHKCVVILGQGHTRLHHILRLVLF